MKNKGHEWIIARLVDDIRILDEDQSSYETCLDTVREINVLCEVLTKEEVQQAFERAKE